MEARKNIAGTALTRNLLVPRAHFVFMLLLAAAFGIQVHLWGDGRWLQPLVLNGWAWSGLLGYMWIHLSVVHVVESIVTLWVFGHKLAQRIGLAKFGLVYLISGLAAAVAHVAVDGRPMVGASGAIMGLLGAHATLYFREFGIPGQLLLVVWVGLTLGLGIIAPTSPASHMGHLGGFLAGITIASLFIRREVVDATKAHPDWLRWLSIPTPTSVAT